MKITPKTKLKKFLLIAEVVNIEIWNSKIANIKLPQNKYVPKNLNDLTWAQLSTILNCKTNIELMFVASEVILKIKRKRLLRSPALQVIAFMIFVEKELEKIGKLFAQIAFKPSPEEVQAGISNLNFGLFGTLDWYAKRMRITDHETAEQTPWIRIYECMKNDNLTAEFQRKLTKIISTKK